MGDWKNSLRVFLTLNDDLFNCKSYFYHFFLTLGFVQILCLQKKFNLMFLISQVEGEKIEGIFMDFKF